MISIWKISCFRLRAANSILHSVSVCVVLRVLPPPTRPLLFFSPSLTHFHSLRYCSVNIKWAPSILLISSQAQMISPGEYGPERGAAGSRGRSEMHGTVRQVTTASTLTPAEPCTAES